MTNRDLDTFKSIIISSEVFVDISYIGITGSIGRGEKDINDLHINDIDFIVIASKCDFNKKQILDKKLQKISNTQFTDILFLKYQKFISAVNKKNVEQYLFDFIFGNIPLYSTICFAEYQKKHYEISILSAKDVLLTRLWSLLAPFSIQDNTFICRDGTPFSLYQLKKAYSAIIDAVLIYEKKYISPINKIKQLNFKQTKFYTINKKEIIRLESYTFKIFDTHVYKIIVNLYTTIIHKVIGENLTYYNFPRKKMIIKSVINKSSLNYLKRIIERYKLMNETVKFVNGNTINQNEYNLKVKKLYKEIINE